MFRVNENYLKLPGSYLFSTIAKKVAAYQKENPDKKLIRLGIGDVTLPIAPAIIDAMHKAVDEMGHAETFHGYAPDLGYAFLRETIAKKDFQERGCKIEADEIFVSDGAKSDTGNIQEIFSADSKIAVCDPVYPVYVDTNVMAGRTGEYDEGKGTWSNVIYMPCTAENGFVPELPKETPDLIYLCVPNNPTGTTLTKDQLKVWVDYANEKGAVILYDAAYEAYISEEDVPHSIYEIPGARNCAIEFRSFSKKAGFTGVNRHEWSPKTGRYISMNEMKSDIECILRNNINAVRTCHYPDQIPWYYMCDAAGIYMMAENNLESHGTFQKLGAIEPSCNVPGSIPQWKEAVVDRARSNFETFKNHTAILFWSLGNESYAGDDIETMNTYYKGNKTAA